MSFDVFVQDLPSEARTVFDIPDDFEALPIGRRVDIVASILRVVPAADFTDPAWGHITGPGYGIEINLGSDEDAQLYSFAFHVRGGQAGIFMVAHILEELGLRALAPGTDSGLFEVGELAEAYSRWQDYRRHVNSADA